MFKKIITFIFEPFNIFGVKGITEGIANFFKKHVYATYILTLLITGLVIFLAYKI